MSCSRGAYTYLTRAMEPAHHIGDALRCPAFGPALAKLEYGVLPTRLQKFTQAHRYRALMHYSYSIQNCKENTQGK